MAARFPHMPQPHTLIMYFMIKTLFMPVITMTVMHYNNFNNVKVVWKSSLVNLQCNFCTDLNINVSLNLTGEQCTESNLLICLIV